MTGMGDLARSLRTPADLTTPKGLLTFADETETIGLAELVEFCTAEDVYWTRDRDAIMWGMLLLQSRLLTARLRRQEGGARGRLIGTTRVRSDGVYEAKLNDVVTAREFQGMGVARELCRWAFRHPFVASATRFVLETHDAEGLYRKFGFTTAQEQDTIHMRAHMSVLREAGHLS